MKRLIPIACSLLLVASVLVACGGNEDLTPIELEAEQETEEVTIAAPASIDLDSILETEPTTEETEPETEETTKAPETKAKETKKKETKKKETKAETKAETEATPEAMVPITPESETSDPNVPHSTDDPNANGPGGSSSIVPEGGEITIVPAGPGSN